MGTKSEKRLIRQKIHQKLGECEGCELNGQNVPKDSVCYTSCKVGLELREFAKFLEQEPNDEKNIVTGRWTNEEKMYLKHHYGIYDIDHLAERLNRSHDSVAMQINKMLHNRKAYIKSYA